VYVPHKGPYREVSSTWLEQFKMPSQSAIDDIEKLMTNQISMPTQGEQERRGWEQESEQNEVLRLRGGATGPKVVKPSISRSQNPMKKPTTTSTKLKDTVARDGLNRNAESLAVPAPASEPSSPASHSNRTRPVTRSKPYGR
jgi:hypothetical protein